MTLNPQGTMEMRAPGADGMDNRDLDWDNWSPPKDFRVTGNSVAILPWVKPAMTKGGVFMPFATQEAEVLTTQVGRVASIGPNAFQDLSRRRVLYTMNGRPQVHKQTGRPVFDDEDEVPKVGDWVIFARYAGIQIAHQPEGGQRAVMRILDDKNILAVVGNPEDYERYLMSVG